MYWFLLFARWLVHQKYIAFVAMSERSFAVHIILFSVESVDCADNLAVARNLDKIIENSVSCRFTAYYIRGGVF